MINCAPVLWIITLSLSIRPARNSSIVSWTCGPCPELVDYAAELVEGDSPRRRAQLASGVRLRSVALIHTCRPSGPRTRPHHSPRSRTQ